MISPSQDFFFTNIDTVKVWYRKPLHPELTFASCTISYYNLSKLDKKRFAYLIRKTSPLDRRKSGTTFFKFIRKLLVFILAVKFIYFILRKETRLTFNVEKRKNTLINEWMKSYISLIKRILNIEQNLEHTESCYKTTTVFKN